MKILVTGSSGYLGENLIDFLSEKKFNISRLHRNKETHKDNFYWDPDNKNINHKVIENSDVIINLNGKRIIRPIKREDFSEIRKSRINPTETLISAINKSKNPPKLIISASACGFYGNRSNEILDENSPKGRGALPDLVEEWETIHKSKNYRIVNLRLGTVLGKKSPMISMMKKYSSIIGVSSFGKGDNYFPWIGLIDSLRAIEHIIQNEKINGPVNITSYKPYILRDVLEDINLRLKPILKLKIPGEVIKILFGGLGDEIMLSNQNIKPRILLESSFNWINSTPFSSIS